MSKTRQDIVTIPKDPGFQISVYAAYSLGGYNHWSGRQDPRGYSVHIQAQEVEVSTTDPSVKYLKTRLLDGSGVRFFVEAASRFSVKTLERIAATAEQHELYAGALARIESYVHARQNPEVP